MPEDIIFSWTGSARAQEASTDPWLAKPAWARIAGLGCAELSSTSPPVTGQHWVLLQETPLVGGTYPLRVWLPFRGALGDYVWVVYPPPTTDPAYTEWCDVPADLPTGGLARCRLLEVLNHDEPDPVYGPGAWLQVAVEETITLPDLADRFAPDSADRPFPVGLTPFRRHTHGCHWGDLNYLAYSAEGDVHEWAVWQRTPDGAAVVLAGVRLLDDDIFYAGHRPLTAEELRDVEAWQEDAEKRRARAYSPATSEDFAQPTNAKIDAAADVRKPTTWRVWERWRSRS